MSATSMLTSKPTLPKDAPRRARLAIAMLNRLAHGQLHVTLPDGEQMHFGSAGPTASISISSWQVFDACLRDGDIGFADSYIAGLWQTDDLRAVLDVLVANRDHIEGLVYGNPLGRILNRLRHAFKRNTKSGAKRNIHAHYDLGNAFYQSWLDRSMTYSSALFDGDFDQSLELAQQAKYDRILHELACEPGAHLLEIGCGWGGFMVRASAQAMSVDGLTISKAQHEFAEARLDAAIKSRQVAPLLRDYRDETRQFDGIVSIEMFEAVGEAYWPSYFETLARCLKADARAVVQTITIDEALFETYRSGSDFIQQTIFPGGMLPSPERFAQHAEQAGLRVINRHGFGRDYAHTLHRWYQRFLQQLPMIRPMGFDDRFIRTWTMYLCYCEAAFRHGNTDVYQFTLEHAK